MGMMLQTIAYTLGKPVGAVILGGAVLWQVARHSGPSNGRALVHVSTTPVELAVDCAVYRVESLDDSPVACELKPGRHAVEMVRDGKVLYYEEFDVIAGRDVVLAAWDQYTDGRSPGRAE
jgi:hypothetical protein